MILCDPWTIARLLCPPQSSGVCSNSSLWSQWSYLTISSSPTTFSSCPQSSQSFPMSQLFTSRGQIIGASASASVLPMNIQGWFLLGLTGLTSLNFKWLSRVFSSTTVQKKDHSLLYSPTLTSLQDYWKSHSFDNTDFCQKSEVSTFKYQCKESK